MRLHSAIVFFAIAMLTWSADAADFNEQEYFKQRELAQSMTAAEISTALESSNISVERVAAICYRVRSINVDEQLNNAKPSLNEALIDKALQESEKLWKQYPGNLEVLNLRLLFSLSSDLKSHPYFECAHILVKGLELKTGLSLSEKELVNSYYLWIYNMHGNYSLQQSIDPNLTKAGKAMLSGVFPRRYSLFDFNSPLPTDADLAMWYLLLKDHASRTTHYKEKWDQRVGSLKAPAMSTMNLEAARTRMDGLVLESLAEEYFGRKTDYECGLIIEHLVQARVENERKIEHNLKHGNPTVEQLGKVARLQSDIKSSPDDFGLHQALASAYFILNLYPEPEYGLAVGRKMEELSCVQKLGFAYYLLLNRAYSKSSVDMADSIVQSLVRDFERCSDRQKTLILAMRSLLATRTNRKADAAQFFEEAKKQGGDEFLPGSSDLLAKPSERWLKESDGKNSRTSEF